MMFSAMKKFFVLLVTGVFLVQSCTAPIRQEAEESAGIGFFPMKQYLLQEAKRLEKANAALTKAILLDGQADTAHVKAVDWQKEFTPFIESDINRLIWQDKFRVDSTTLDNGTVQTTYTSSDRKVPVKKLDVFRQNGQVSKIAIQTAIGNSWYKNHRSMTYTPATGYRIDEKQWLGKWQQYQSRVTGNW